MTVTVNYERANAIAGLLSSGEGLEGLGNRLIEVEARLHAAVEHSDALAASTSRHLVYAGGKRVRPILTLLAAYLGDPGRDEVLQAAVAVELTHLATLYHDDVMDSAETRRGAPTAQTVWGNSIAIITGDLLFARASRLVSGLGAEAVLIQSLTFERLCLGQLHETVGPQPGDDPVQHYLSVLADKTGSLIATSGVYGAMFAGCDRDIIDPLAAYGEKVGVAFQLADDVIDLMPTDTGKDPGTDLREGVATMPALLARQAAAEGDREADELVRLIDGDLTDQARLAETVVALREHDVTTQTRSLAQTWAQAAIDDISVLPAGPVHQALDAFARSVVYRDA